MEKVQYRFESVVQEPRAGKSMLWDDSYKELRAMRQQVKITIAVICNKQPTNSMLEQGLYGNCLPLQQRASSVAAGQQERDPTVFPSLIRTQNPQGYCNQDDSQSAIEVKYDIHSLLVDTQNYYQKEKQAHHAQMNREELMRSR